jgi:hypothetical protein
VNITLALATVKLSEANVFLVNEIPTIESPAAAIVIPVAADFNGCPTIAANEFEAIALLFQELLEFVSLALNSPYAMIELDNKIKIVL